MMEWDNASSLKLIEHYRENRCLWDLNCEEHKNVFLREEAWRNIAWMMNRDATEVKKKMDSLLASFRRERLRYFGAKTPPKPPQTEDYKTKWFGYNSMKFLLTRYPPKSASNNMKMVDFDEQEDMSENQITVEEHQPTTSRIKSELTPLRVEELKSYPELKNTSRKRKGNVQDDSWVDEAYKILKSAVNHEKDCSAVFGEYVATKLRGYSPYTRSTVEHLISNILYNAGIGKYDEAHKQTNQPTSSISIDN